MITIISATNRKDSEALRFARHYYDMLRELAQEDVKLLALEDIAHDWFHPDMYEHPSESLIHIQEEYILPAHKFLFILSEYNGGMPGVLKLFIDAVSVRKYKENFKGKKVAMVGIATGRAGNLRGMDQLTSVMHHLGAIVLPNQLPISRIAQLVGTTGTISDEATLAVIDRHVAEFLRF